MYGNTEERPRCLQRHLRVRDRHGVVNKVIFSNEEPLKLAAVARIGGLNYTAARVQFTSSVHQKTRARAEFKNVYLSASRRASSMHICSTSHSIACELSVKLSFNLFNDIQVTIVASFHKHSNA